jgi:hypothetical protein
VRIGSGIGAALLLLAALTSAGCGGSGTEVVAAPDSCLESWNSDASARNFGSHVYDGHDSHRAQVAIMEPIGSAPNVDAAGACAVVFAIPETDVEYGDVGLVETDLGWASLLELSGGDLAALQEVQDAASAAANASLFPDGTLEPN